jgi:hypothetical protein
LLLFILIVESREEQIMLMTAHAGQRLGQRGISEEELQLVLTYGTKVHNAGALFVFMRRRDIPRTLSPHSQDHLEGLTIVLDPLGEEVITAYRNRRALREIKRKSKRFFPRQAA